MLYSSGIKNIAFKPVLGGCCINFVFLQPSVPMIENWGFSYHVKVS